MDLDTLRLDDFPERLDTSGLILSDWNQTEFLLALERFAGNVLYAQRRLAELGLDGWSDPGLVDLLKLQPFPAILVDYFRKNGGEPECSRRSTHTHSDIRLRLSSVEPRPGWRDRTFVDSRFADSLPARHLEGMEIPDEIHVYRWYDRDDYAIQADVAEGEVNVLLGERNDTAPSRLDIYASFPPMSSTRRFEVMRLILEFLRLASTAKGWAPYQAVEEVAFSDLAIDSIVRWFPGLIVKPTRSYHAAIWD